MVSFSIPDVKEFMAFLLKGETFDNFSVAEVRLKMGFTTVIDGTLSKEFYSEEEREALGLEGRGYVPWRMVKPQCFSVIRGRKTPEGFSVTLLLSEADVEKVLGAGSYGLEPNQVKGLLLNVRYDGKGIRCTTATSLSSFTLDKSLEREWDRLAMAFMKKNGIAVVEE